MLESEVLFHNTSNSVPPASDLKYTRPFQISKGEIHKHPSLKEQVDHV